MSMRHVLTPHSYILHMHSNKIGTHKEADEDSDENGQKTENSSDSSDSSGGSDTDSEKSRRAAMRVIKM